MYRHHREERVKGHHPKEAATPREDVTCGDRSWRRGKAVTPMGKAIQREREEADRYPDREHVAAGAFDVHLA